MIISFVNCNCKIQNDTRIYINAQHRNISIQEIKKMKDIILRSNNDVIIVLKNYNKSYLDTIRNLIKMSKKEKHVVLDSENESEYSDIQYLINDNSNIVVSIKNEKEFNYHFKKANNKIFFSIDYNILLNKLPKLKANKNYNIILKISDLSKCSVDTILSIGKDIRLYGIEVKWSNIKGSCMRHLYSVSEYINILTKLNSFSKNIDKYKSEYYKFIQAYYLIGRNIQFDFDDDGEPSRISDSHSLRGGVLKGKAVCEGYSESLSQLLNILNIENKCVTGVDRNCSNGSMHVWNQVKINGNWYNCDITNDSVNIRENRQVDMCLLSDKDFFLYKAISDNAEVCEKTWNCLDYDIER